MVKKEKFWNATRITITTILLLLALFFLFKTGVFEPITSKFFSVSSDPTLYVASGSGGSIS